MSTTKASSAAPWNSFSTALSSGARALHCCCGVTCSQSPLNQRIGGVRLRCGSDADIAQRHVLYCFRALQQQPRHALHCAVPQVSAHGPPRPVLGQLTEATRVMCGGGSQRRCLQRRACLRDLVNAVVNDRRPLLHGTSHWIQRHLCIQRHVVLRARPTAWVPSHTRATFATPQPHSRSRASLRRRLLKNRSLAW